MGPISPRDRAAERLAASRELAMRLAPSAQADVVDASEPAIEAAVEPIHQKIIVEPIKLKSRLTVREIRRVVSDYFRIPQDEISGPRRFKELTTPRQIVMHLSREYTHASFPQIGRVLGRDHTSVIHGANKIAKRADDPGIVEALHAITAAIEAAGFERVRA